MLHKVTIINVSQILLIMFIHWRYNTYFLQFCTFSQLKGTGRFCNFHCWCTSTVKIISKIIKTLKKSHFIILKWSHVPWPRSPFFLLSMWCSRPVSSAQTNLQTIMFPPSCFTVLIISSSSSDYVTFSNSSPRSSSCVVRKKRILGYFGKSTFCTKCSLLFLLLKCSYDSK